MIDQIFAYAGGDLLAALKTRSGGNPVQVQRIGNIARVSLFGVLDRLGTYDGTSTDLTALEIEKLATDPTVAAIVLDVNSPGGAVAGTDDLARTIAETAQKKPTAAFITDVGASAAYWCASQAGKVCVSPMAAVGGIGTYATLTDMSGMAGQLGLKVHVVRAGQFKGTGTPGAEITTEQLTEVQRVVDSLNSHFLAAVVRGRKLSQEKVAALADGRVHIGAEAVRLGLADGVATYSQFWQSVIRQFSVTPKPVNAVAEFDREVNTRTTGGMSRAKAIAATVAANPELHRQYLAQINGRN